MGASCPKMLPSRPSRSSGGEGGFEPVADILDSRGIGVSLVVVGTRRANWIEEQHLVVVWNLIEQSPGVLTIPFTRSKWGACRMHEGHFRFASDNQHWASQPLCDAFEGIACQLGPGVLQIFGSENSQSTGERFSVTGSRKCETVSQVVGSAPDHAGCQPRLERCGSRCVETTHARPDNCNSPGINVVTPL